jgi:putative transposase
MAANREDGIKDEVLDQLLEGRDPATVFETGGLVDELKKRLAERMLNAEMDHHLDAEAEEAAGNHRNGYGAKTVLTDTGKLELAIPRDRHGRFDRVLIGKYRRRFAGFDDKIIALYARGLTTREIAAHVGELYGVEISPDLVSAVTDAVLEEVAAWQSRGLEATYAIVFFDAIRVKIRNEGLVNNRSVYLAIGMRCAGHKEILGLWIEQTEGAKFWLRVMTELRNRGTQDILIAVVDGLKGFPEAITSVFPKTLVQTCIVHLIRYSMHFASWKERRPVALALKPIYQAEAAAAARERLEDFDRGPWGQKYPAIAQSWRRNWEQVIPFFAFAPDLRKILYTTNAIESLNAQVRKAVRVRGHFPSEEAATKLLRASRREGYRNWSSTIVPLLNPSARSALRTGWPTGPWQLAMRSVNFSSAPGHYAAPAR